VAWVVTTNPRNNQLLEALPQRARERIFPKLREVEMPLGKQIYAPGEARSTVYFPSQCIVALMYTMDDGHSAEISVIGNEGLVGIAVALGGESMTFGAIVQNAGLAYKLPAADLKLEFEQDRSVRRLVLRYTQALITQIAHTAVCNCHHSIHQQLCRWMLLSLDRLPTNEILITQEVIANMLGVRREAVTRAARRLQAKGVIAYR
jgi:CRP-like cAMP-binding protein